MKKNTKSMLILLITILLLTGCGEKEKDYENEKNPTKFVQENFYNYYQKETEINKVEEKVQEKDTTKLIELSLKEDKSFTFDACTYWVTNYPIPNRYYTSVNNYENKYNTKFITESLKDEFGMITIEETTTDYNESCHLSHENTILELEDTLLIPTLSTRLSRMNQEKETYALHLTVKYHDKKVNITINHESNEEDYLKELTKLMEAEEK